MMTSTDPLRAAQDLAPLVAALRGRLDRERRLPDELIQAIADAGLFAMWLPNALGGPEQPPLVFMEAIEELSRQDGSVGWCAAIAAGHARFAGALPGHAASEIFGSGRTVLAGTVNPVGEAVPVPGGYRVTGHWAYGSVIDHAQWVYGNCVVRGAGADQGERGRGQDDVPAPTGPDAGAQQDWHGRGQQNMPAPTGPDAGVRQGGGGRGQEGAPAPTGHTPVSTGPDGGARQSGGGRSHGDGPELRLCLFPREAVDVIDTWHVSGLRGTGSHDFAVKDLFVPEDNTIPLRDYIPVPTRPGPIYAIPVPPIFSSILAAIQLGIARAAIEALVALAAGKTPMGSPAVLRERALVQADVARAEALVRAGRALLFSEVETMWRDVLDGRTVTSRRRALVRLAAVEAGRYATQAVDLVHAAGGGTSIREDNPIERCWRDAHAAARHFSVSEHSNLEPIGRVLLGLEPGMARF